jgi:hypothetical protein
MQIVQQNLVREQEYQQSFLANLTTWGDNNDIPHVRRISGSVAWKTARREHGRDANVTRKLYAPLTTPRRNRCVPAFPLVVPFFHTNRTIRLLNFALQWLGIWYELFLTW